MNLDLDYRLFDGTETVTFSPQNPAGPAVTVEGALRRELQRQEVQMAGAAALAGELLAWHLPNANLAGEQPKPGDTITEVSGPTWTILSVRLETLGTRWKAVCAKQR